MTKAKAASSPWKFDFASYWIGATLTFVVCIAIMLLENHSNRKAASTLSESEIIYQTDTCNREGRLSEARIDEDGNITKIWCGLPPFEDKRSKQRLRQSETIWQSHE